MSAIIIKGKRCAVGSRLKIKDDSYEGIPLTIGMEVTIHSIKGGSVGIIADQQMPGWHDFMGKGPSNRCLWIEVDSIEHYLEPTGSKKFVVAKAYRFGGTELKGKKGHIIQETDSGLFVEMEEHIKGIGCDGLGKKGHCAFIPKDCITYKSDEEQKKKVKDAN